MGASMRFLKSILGEGVYEETKVLKFPGTPKSKEGKENSDVISNIVDETRGKVVKLY